MKIFTQPKSQTRRFIMIIVIFILLCGLSIFAYFLSRIQSRIEYEKEVVEKDRSLPYFNKYGLHYDQTPSDVVLYEDDSVVIYSDRYVNKLSILENAPDEFSLLVNAFVNFNGGNSEVIVVPVPKRIQFEANSLDSNETYANFLEKLEGIIPSTAKLIDTAALLERDDEHFLYFKTQDNWTPEAAYYAYQEVCQALGLEAYDRDYFIYYQNNDFLGDSAQYWINEFNGTDYEDLMPDITDPFIYRKSLRFKDYETVCSSRTDLEYKRPVFLYSLPGINGYIATDRYAHLYGYGEGSVMVIGDSSGKQIAPYLTEHFADVFYVDIERCHTPMLKQLLNNLSINSFVISQNVDNMGDRSYSRALNGFLE